MKRNLIITTVIFAIIMTLGVTAGVLAAAEPEIAIKYGNLQYKDGEVSLGYAVDFGGVPSDAERGLLVWQDGFSKHYIKGREDRLLLPDDEIEIDGKKYTTFLLDGIAERELTDDVYAVAYARVGTRVIYSEVNKHSPLRYSYIAEGKIGNSPVSDGKVLSFLSEMITAGATAQRAESYKLDRLADADFVEILLDGGVFEDGMSKGLFASGEQVKATPDEAYGKNFSAWKDAKGANVSTSDGYIRIPAEGGKLIPTYVDASTGLEFDLMASDAKFDTVPPSSYVFGENMKLPVPTRAGYVFSGWYTDEKYEVTSVLDSIKPGTKGDIKLYAAWTRLLWEDDHSKLTGINVNASSSKGFTTPSGTNYRCANKDGSSFTSVAGGLAWHAGSVGSDNMVSVNGGLAGLMGDDNTVTIVAKIALDQGKTPARSTARLRVSYKNETIALFNVSDDGSVYLGGDAMHKITTLTNEMQEIRVIVDFERGTFTAVGENGELIATRGFDVPGGSKHKDRLEWKSDLTSYVMNWYAGGSAIEDNSIIVGGISVWKGTAFLRTTERVISTDELEAKLAELISANNAFNMQIFESKYSPIKSTGNTSMPAPVYDAAPKLFARDDGDGTRLMFTTSMLEGILASMEDDAYSKSYESLVSLANSETDGILGNPISNYNGRKGLHNYNASILAQIEAKAFMFRLLYEQDPEEGSYDAIRRDVYGYSAIVAMKNFLRTLDIQYINSDQCREYGYTMFVAAEVYDWCYPILTDKDKAEIKYAVVARCCSGTSGSTDNTLTTNNGAKMEVGFPPAGQGSVSGHGSEAQILRDYLSFALAIYDEDPTWWEYVAGRVVGDYVAVRNIYHESGITQQGVSNYAQHRHYSDLYSAWIIKTATGVNPYTRMEKTVISVLGSMTPAGLFFSNGDGGTKKNVSTAANLAFISSAIYNNDTLFTWAHGFKSGFNLSAQAGNTTVTLPSLFIFLGQGMELVEDKYAGLDLIQYNGYPLGQIISRYEWNNADAAATYMKLGIRTTANHEHKDAGTFHIYYKGLLTSDSGLYNNYGHEQTQYYHQATIAHNGLLVFNPALWNYNSTSAATKWYSGGQRKPGEAKNLTVWLGETYDTAVLMGAQYGYKNAERTRADYAYIAGDITKAYTADTVSSITRSMLTVYNESSDFPMYFFVFDSIEATDASFKKTFLLHAIGANEPKIEGNAVTLVNGEGKLVSHTLTDGATIEAVGGIAYDSNGKYDVANSKNYLINGHQIIPLDGGNDGNWGRVEVSLSGEKKSTFMHAMYVTDKDGTAKAPTVEKIAADGIEGAIIGDVAAVFRDSTKRTLESVSFAIAGDGELKYYVAGLFEGTWKLTIDGRDQGTVTAGEGGMAVFTAPRGEVVLTPGDDIMPAGGGRVFYETAGGTLPEDAPNVFGKGESLTLPTPTNGIHRFAGWYTSPDLTGEPIAEIPGGAAGEITVYAKWNYVFADEDFETYDLEVSGVGGGRVLGNLNLSILKGTKAEMKTKTDKTTKEKYLVVSPAGGEISIAADGYPGISSLGVSKVTYSFDLSTSSEGRSPRVLCAINGARSFYLFTVSADGGLNVGNRKIATLTKELTKYSFTLDFSTLMLTVTDGDGKQLYRERFNNLTIGDLEKSIFEITVSDGSSGLSKYNFEIGRIEVKAD